MLCESCGRTVGATPLADSPTAAKKRLSAPAIVGLGCASLCLLFILVAIIYVAVTRARDRVFEKASIRNMQIIGKAVRTYEARNHNTLPPTDSMDRFQKALWPYISHPKPSLFIEPGVNEPYELDDSVSGVPLSKIDDGGSAILMIETSAHWYDMLVVLYVDGHVAVEDEGSSDVQRFEA
jgi:hypothetical protein